MLRGHGPLQPRPHPARAQAWEDGLGARGGARAVRSARMKARAAAYGGALTPTFDRPTPDLFREPRRIEPPEWPCGKCSSAASTVSRTNAGSLHAPDAEMAIRNARDVYAAQRGRVDEPRALVRRRRLVARRREALFDPAQSKVYRHPTFFQCLTRSSASRFRDRHDRRDEIPVPASSGRQRPRSSRSACPSGWARTGDRGGHRAHQRRARPDRPGADVSSPTQARSRPRPR